MCYLYITDKELSIWLQRNQVESLSLLIWHNKISSKKNDDESNFLINELKLGYQSHGWNNLVGV